MYMIENKLAEAKEMCEKSISLQPEGSEAHMNLGNVLRTLNDRGSAIEHVWL
jgi:predicted Zn-dependent protease